MGRYLRVRTAMLALLSLCTGSLASAGTTVASAPATAAKFGIFYSLWHCPYSPESPLASSSIRAGNVPDMSAIEAESGSNPISRVQAFSGYLKNNVTMFWQNRPADGYYCLDGSAKGRQEFQHHAQQLRDAGVDFVFVDFTNNVLSPNGISGAEGCSSHAPYNNWNNKDRKVSPCTGFDYTTQMTPAIATAFKVMLQEWSQVPNAPKIVPWVPLTRFNSADNLFVKDGEVRFPDSYEIMGDFVYKFLKGVAPNRALQFNKLLLLDPSDGKPVIFNVVNNLFPEDTSVEQDYSANKGFHVQNVWARFPDSNELLADQNYLLKIVLAPLGLSSLPHFEYPIFLKYMLVARMKASAVPALRGVQLTDHLDTILQVLRAADHTDSNFQATLNAIKLNLNGYFYHSVDVDSMWRWRGPCSHPRNFKDRGASAPCEQRASQGGQVLNVSAAYDWNHFTQERTSIGRMDGAVFNKYFDTVDANAGNLQYVLIGSWNQWLGSQEHCSMPYPRDKTKYTNCDAKGDCQVSFPNNVPTADEDYRNSTAAANPNSPNRSSKNYWYLPGLDPNSPSAYHSSIDPIICQTIVSPSFPTPNHAMAFAWMAKKDAEGNYFRSIPDFHHEWIGQNSTDFEPSVRLDTKGKPMKDSQGKALVDESMYRMLQKRILRYKESHAK